jgi:hypothetical protein
MRVGNLDISTYVTCAGQRRSKVWPKSRQPEHRVEIDNPTTIDYRVAVKCRVPGANPRLAYYVDNAFRQTWDTQPVWVGGFTTRLEENAIARTATPPGPSEFQCYNVEIMHPHGSPQQHSVVIPVIVTAK